ncbi:alpha-L-rhamnosidase C-terminal domain-containing protein [Streptomyces sp. ME02-8801-2C]|uniref:alpha-L-rhamnosidase C-terminal domain-containing protein n=1 Tax=Streptomyces sp. ME02-8801-2C TaxID=3028680 RepID=UPI0039F6B4B7
MHEPPRRSSAWDRSCVAAVDPASDSRPCPATGASSNRRRVRRPVRTANGHDTPYGPTAVSWRREDGRFRLHVEVPVGAGAGPGVGRRSSRWPWSPGSRRRARQRPRARSGRISTPGLVHPSPRHWLRRRASAPCRAGSPDRRRPRRLGLN